MKRKKLIKNKLFTSSTKHMITNNIKSMLQVAGPIIALIN